MATRLALSLALVTAVAGVWLLIERGGLIAALALVLGLLLAWKIWQRPGTRDLVFALSLIVLTAAGWFGTFYYVIATWESGEVIELAMDTNEGSHTARLWVMDIEGVPTVYYDAPPAAAAALLEGKPVQFTRAGVTTTLRPQATAIEALSEKDGQKVLQAMATKYPDQSHAADLYYVLIGSPWDRVSLVARLAE